ncbi:neuronal acetylcholine receptor subunit alpha-7-like [Haliotis rubra]|uniref:neuronal acetylcholine receptor subunit alpha-7-like n=1 Tax=Haliotis rubra TaxID=36100 RepID=UPI001EE5BCA9|nr:neuronal acetylcholine receptor subunit alpha-7-like [Haliotis rubra]
MATRLLPLLVTALHISGVSSFNVANETQLRSDLLTNYSLKSRPEPVTSVSLVFNLLTINQLETRTQTFSVSGYFTVVWNDTRLKWNPSTYNGIGFFFADETEIWRPSLVVKNAVDNLDVIANDNIPMRIGQGGLVYWNPPGIYITHCNIDITYYPFDSQECSVVVQSWGYNLRELDLFKFGSGVETAEFERNGEWNLNQAYSQRTEKVHDVDSETYATVAFIFKMQRKPDYYGVNIILPVVVLSILSALVFVLPPDSGEKMGYSLTVLLSFAVFLTLIADRMPTTSRDTSFMAVYLAVILCLSGLSVLLTVIVLDFHFREDEIPYWLEQTTKVVIMPLVCSRGCRKSRSVSASNSDIAGEEPKFKDVQSIRERGSQKKSHSNLSDRASSAASSTADLTWKDIARAFDTLFFRFYVIVIALITLIFLFILGLASSTNP